MKRINFFAGKRILAVLLGSCLILNGLLFSAAASNPPIVEQESSVSGTKTASLIGSQENGVYQVTLGVSATPKITIGASGALVTTVPSDLLITDNMSPYVDFLPGTLQLMERVGGGAWNPSFDGIPNFNPAAGGNGAITCTISFTPTEKEYMLVYQVQVRAAYAGQRSHKEQTSGANPQAGSDGLILNGLTTVRTNLTGPVEVLVPTGWRSAQDRHVEHILIQKEDKATGGVLSGFRFEMRNSGGVPVGSVTTQTDTDKNRFSVIGYSAGTYTLWEAAVQPGYDQISVPLAEVTVVETTSDKYFTVSPSTQADVSLVTAAANTDVLIVRNRKIDQTLSRNKLLLSKIDGDSGRALFGFQFELRDAVGKAVKTVLTQTDFNLNALNATELDAGTYTLWETAVQPGYNRIGVSLAEVRVVENASGKEFLVTPSAHDDVSLDASSDAFHKLVVRNWRLTHYPGFPGYVNRPGSNSSGSGRDRDRDDANSSRPGTSITDKDPPLSNGGGSGGGSSGGGGGGRLPQTGGLPIELVGIGGASLVGVGLWWNLNLKKKKKNDSEPEQKEEK